MGNKCPSGFQNNPTNPIMCVHECPKDKGFELQMANGLPACVYRTRPEIFFPLRSAPAFNDKTIEQYPTVDDLPANAPAKPAYTTAIEEFKKESASALEKVDRDIQLADAFRELQTAENVRDTSPQAYQDARVRYYTLLKGETWIEEEKARITQSEVAPKIAGYMASYQDMATRETQQQRTMDIVRGVKDKLLSLKDDFKMTTDVFSKQLDDLRSQIVLEKKRSQQEKETTVSWIHFVVNVLLVLFAIAAIFTLVRKLASNKSSSAYTPSSTTS